jgi:manganese/zinc/iron transport system substrate-binding protein
MQIIRNCRTGNPMAVLNRRQTLLAMAGIIPVAAGFAYPALGDAAGGAAPASGLSLVATTGMLADALRTVAGDRARVTALMGEGVDPHTYRQTRSDIAAMVRADGVFWHGLYLEAQLEEFFGLIAEKRFVRPVCELALDRSLLIAHDEYPDRFDPHVWMDPLLWRRVIERTAVELAGLDPAGREVYAARAASYAAEAADLAAYSEGVLATVEPHARVLVTAHDAFRYFGRAYGFEVLGIQGVSTESEAGLRRIEDLVSVLVDRRIGALFVESSVSERNVRALVEGAAARGHAVEVGGRLYSDAMGRPGTYEGTWIGMIDHNVTTIARALGGSAPERGFRGRLDVAMGAG